MTFRTRIFLVLVIGSSFLMSRAEKSLERETTNAIYLDSLEFSNKGESVYVSAYSNGAYYFSTKVWVINHSASNVYVNSKDMTYPSAVSVNCSSVNSATGLIEVEAGNKRLLECGFDGETFTREKYDSFKIRISNGEPLYYQSRISYFTANDSMKFILNNNKMHVFLDSGNVYFK